MITFGGIEIVGRDAILADIQELPEAMQRELRKVARDTALRIKARARELVPKATGTTADSIGVRPDLANKQYVVDVVGAPHNRRGERTADFAKLPFWLEYGTFKMAARPFMRPAADAEEERYYNDIIRAVETAMKALA